MGWESNLSKEKKKHGYFYIYIIFKKQDFIMKSLKILSYAEW